jgi:hypothetical protein
MVIKIYCFDIDETICHTDGTDYENSSPIGSRIMKINSLYESGCIIKFHTARGSKTGLDWRDLTENQLSSWGVKYHELHMGKPFADVYVDDKGIRDLDFDWRLI